MSSFNNQGVGGYSNMTVDNLAMTRPLLGKVNKLSNKGWNYHFRLLKMDAVALTYFKTVPKDFDGKHNI